MSFLDPQHVCRRVANHLQHAQLVLLVAHRQPDGDTLGAATAMAHVLRQLQVPYILFCPTPPSAGWSHLPHVEEFLIDADALPFARIDTVIFFDISDLPYSGFVPLLPRFPRRPTLIQFDHHATNDFFADFNVVMPTAASTTEVLWTFFRIGHFHIDRHIATSFLTGVITDTTAFTNPATTLSAVRFGGACLLKGASLPTVVRQHFQNKRITDLKLWGTMLTRLRRHPRYDIAVTVITLRDIESSGSDPESVEGVANFLNTLGETKASLILRELPGGRVKGSFRTTRADVNVGRLALLFGGGGHTKAAGFTIDGTLVETTMGWRVE